MTLKEIFSLQPFIIISLAPVILMILAAIKRSHKLTYILSLFSFLVAILSLIPVSSVVPVYVSSLIIVDSFSLFFMGLIFAAGFIITVLSYNYFNLHPAQKEEYYILFFVATLGAALLTACNHFITLFLGLEMLSVSLYSMISYLRHRGVSIEAGVKYLILAAASSAFLLFGIALIYAGYGKLGFNELAFELSISETIPPVVLIGLVMMLVGVGFKLAVVPFHMWTPDVYEGAPAPVTAFIASISKGGVFAFLLRFFVQIQGFNYKPLVIIFTVIAIASMFTGNFLALQQNNIKRILAYSSITHLGYLIIALLASKYSGIEAGTFYLVAYIITIIGAFGIVGVLSPCEKDTENIEDYTGLFWKRPWLAAIFSAMLFSLAGIPLTIGFFGKFYLLSAGIEGYLWLLIIVLIVNSAISIYYYLKIVVVMFKSSSDEATNRKLILNPSVAIGSSIVLSFLFFLLIWLGIYPTGILDIINVMVKL